MFQLELQPSSGLPDGETAIPSPWISWDLALNFWNLESGPQAGIAGDLVTDKQAQGLGCILNQGRIRGELLERLLFLLLCHAERAVEGT